MSTWEGNLWFPWISNHWFRNIGHTGTGTKRMGSFLSLYRGLIMSPSLLLFSTDAFGLSSLFAEAIRCLLRIKQWRSLVEDYPGVYIERRERRPTQQSYQPRQAHGANIHSSWGRKGGGRGGWRRRVRNQLSKISWLHCFVDSFNFDRFSQIWIRIQSTTP
jgi:hypothetical protein